MAEAYLVCEGPVDGLDARVLAILPQKLGVFVRIEPAGGDRNLAGVRTYIEARGPSVALAIEDRNYRPRAHAEATWAGAKRNLVWRRHEIENYLLEPRLLLAAFDSLRRARPALPRDEPAVVEVLAELAGTRLHEHAARMLEHDLHTKTTNGNPTDFRLRGRSRAEWGRSEWLRALRDEAERVLAGSEGVARLPDLAPAAIEERYDALLGDVQRPEFIGQRDHLVDMAGKELLAALALRFGLSRETLEDELVRVLPDVYEPGRLFAPDELAMLRDRITLLA